MTPALGARNNVKNSNKADDGSFRIFTIRLPKRRLARRFAGCYSSDAGRSLVFNIGQKETPVRAGVSKAWWIRSDPISPNPNFDSR